VQTLTQVQEQTLSFVPKLVTMGIVFLFCLPTIGHALADFMLRTSDHIIHG
jgi:flagellar biosynthetic protein FliQ